MKFNIMIMMINTLMILSILNVNYSKFIDLKSSFKLKTKMIALLSAGFLFNMPPIFAIEELSLQEQIQNLQVQQLTMQKERFQVSHHHRDNIIYLISEIYISRYDIFVYSFI